VRRTNLGDTSMWHKVAHNILEQCKLKATARADAAMWRKVADNILAQWRVAFSSPTRKLEGPLEGGDASAAAQEQAPPFFRITRRALCDSHFWRFLLDFTRASLFSSESVATSQAATSLAFTDWAIDDLLRIMEVDYPELGARAGLTRQGSMKVVYDESEWGAIVKAAGGTPGEEHTRLLEFVDGREQGVLLSPSEALRIAPELACDTNVGRICGVKFTPGTASAHCEWFTQGLAEICRERLGVAFMFNTKVVDVIAEGGSVESLVLRQEGRTFRIPVGPRVGVVFAAGSWTPRLLSSLNLYVPMYPLKGYTLLIDRPAEVRALPSHRIVASEFVYATRFHDQVRVASMGHFDGWNLEADADTVSFLKREWMDMYPEMRAEADRIRVVVGLRPFVADGNVLAGRVSAYHNLFVVGGPGFNGWKTASGAAEIVASAVETTLHGADAKAESAKFPFDVSLFSPAGRVKSRIPISWI